MPSLQDINNEMAMLHKQLEGLHAEQAKLLEREHELRTRLQHLQIKRDRLGTGTGGFHEADSSDGVSAE